jgi:hypothetical protein
MFTLLAFFIQAEPTHVYIITGSGKSSNKMTATHQGTSRVQVGNSTVTLHNALFVTHLSTNLISFLAMVKETAVLHCAGNFVEMKLNGNHSIRVTTDNGIFELSNVRCGTTLGG